MRNNIDIFPLDLDNITHRDAFYELNVEWLKKYFYVEEIDKQILSQPHKIIENDGSIFLVQYEDELVGTVSLIKSKDGEFELSKLAVTSSYQGLSLGKRLMEKIIETAKDKGLDKIYIASNRKLVPAIKLYEKFGFVESQDSRHEAFERGDITLELTLS